MSLGLPVNKQRIDSQVGDTVYQLREVLARVQRLKVDIIDDMTPADLAALGYTTDEVTLLEASVTDLAKLADIAHGQATQAEASDFFFNARHCAALS